MGDWGKKNPSLGGGIDKLELDKHKIVNIIKMLHLENAPAAR